MQAATTQFDYLFSVARTCYNDWWVGSSKSKQRGHLTQSPAELRSQIKKKQKQLLTRLVMRQALYIACNFMCLLQVYSVFSYCQRPLRPLRTTLEAYTFLMGKLLGLQERGSHRSTKTWPEVLFCEAKSAPNLFWEILWRSSDPPISWSWKYPRPLPLFGRLNHLRSVSKGDRRPGFIKWLVSSSTAN